MSGESGIQFQFHPDHRVEYLGRRYSDAKLVNGVWYFRDGDKYKPFPLQNEVHLLAQDRA